MKMAEFFKWMENIVGKGEIEQFLLFLQCFQKTCTADTLKEGLVWERVNSLPNDKILEQWSIFKDFADKINMTYKLNFLWVE